MVEMREAQQARQYRRAFEHNMKSVRARTREIYAANVKMRAACQYRARK